MTDAMPTTRLIRVDAPVEGHEGVALVTIDRPEARNALSLALLAELADALETLDRDGRTRAAVLTGAGDKAFAAGADIVELADQTPDRLRAEGHFGAWDRLGAIGIPLIAAERLIYKVSGVATSFTEMMGLPDSELDKVYYLPWYNNVELDTQLRFANVSGATASVHVYIGGVEMQGSPFPLEAGASTRKSFAGVNDGPVRLRVMGTLWQPSGCSIK